MAVFNLMDTIWTINFKLIKVSHEIGNERNITTDSAKDGVNIQQVAFNKNQTYC